MCEVDLSSFSPLFSPSILPSVKELQILVGLIKPSLNACSLDLSLSRGSATSRSSGERTRSKTHTALAPAMRRSAPGGRAPRGCGGGRPRAPGGFDRGSAWGSGGLRGVPAGPARGSGRLRLTRPGAPGGSGGFRLARPAAPGAFGGLRRARPGAPAGSRGRAGHAAAAGSAQLSPARLGSTRWARLAAAPHGRRPAGCRTRPALSDHSEGSVWARLSAARSQAPPLSAPPAHAARPQLPPPARSAAWCCRNRSCCSCSHGFYKAWLYKV